MMRAVGADRPLDEDERDRWRAEADRALQAARVQEAAGLHNWACFAAEQAAQLALKALLHGVGAAPWGHDLVRLGDLVNEKELALDPDVADAVRRLARHYIPSRYPDAHASGTVAEHYGASDASSAIEDAELVLAFADRIWSELHA